MFDITIYDESSVRERKQHKMNSNELHNKSPVRIDFLYDVVLS